MLIPDFHHLHFQLWWLHFFLCSCTAALSALLTKPLLLKKLFASITAVSSRFFLLLLTIILCVSSAKFDKVLFSVHKSRSAIKILNSNGDNLEPWGVPIFMPCSHDLLPDTLWKIHKYFSVTYLRWELLWRWPVFIEWQIVIIIIHVSGPRFGYRFQTRFTGVNTELSCSGGWCS